MTTPDPHLTTWAALERSLGLQTHNPPPRRQPPTITAADGTPEPDLPTRTPED